MKLSKTLVVLDLETTGVWIEKDKIIEIALIRLEPDGSEEVYQQRINPGIPIPPKVTEITGIKDADVKDCQTFKEVVDDVLKFIGEADLAGFNVERFDLPLLEREVFETGRRFEWREHTVYDAQKIYHLNERRDLQAAYKFFCDKELKDAHAAVADAKATVEILAAQVEKYGEGKDTLKSIGHFDYQTLDEYYDSGRKFRWWNEELYPMFGKYARKLTLRQIVHKDASYLQWILNADFSDEVKELVENALKGQYPSFLKDRCPT